MLTIRTNVDSLNAQMVMKQNALFQSKTIQQLTSGYRINYSGDDGAGLAVANTLRSNIVEISQGVANANDGIGQLQIIDGGLSNISTLMDRMKSLATQSASGTFAGDRSTLNQEYQQLIQEITRQASNIGLNNGGSFNTAMQIYLGGAPNQANAGSLLVDLSGVQHGVDSSSLGLAGTNILSDGVTVGTAGNRLDTTGATFVTGTSPADDETFTFNLFSGSTTVSKAVTVAASAAGSSLQTVLNSFNSTLNPYGVQATVDSNGKLQFGGNAPFSFHAGTTTGSAGIMNSVLDGTNTSDYVANGQTTYSAAAQTLTFTVNGASTTVSLAGTDNLASAISKVNAQMSVQGVYAIANGQGTGLSIQSNNNFTVSASAAGAFAASGAQVTAPPTVGAAGGSAQAAIGVINAAVQRLGLTQGIVGAGENKLQYAINLAQSEISSFSAAESQIRDADVAAQAANLTKAQVLQQTSIAAMAQANQIPQAAVKLLQQ